MKTRLVCTVLIIAIGIYIANPVLAQSKPAIEGTYDLTIAADGYPTVALTLVITRQKDKLEAQSSGDPNLTISGIAVDGDNVTLKAAYQDFQFDLPGKIGDGEMGGKFDADRASGTWSAKRRT